MAPLKTVDLAELAEHTKEKDCWMAINGKVYDVTKFLDEHPGGFDIMLECSGRDATDEFEDVGHSSTAYEMLDQFLVGELPEGERKGRTPKRKVSAANAGNQAGPGITALKALIPVLLALLIGAYFLISD